MTAAEITPSTDEIRQAYQYTDDGLDFRRARDRRGAEFDRWLAEHDAETRRKALEEAETAVGASAANPHVTFIEGIINSVLRSAADRIHLLIESETRS